MGDMLQITYYRPQGAGLPQRMRSHKDMDAWKKSMDMVDSIYKVNKRFNIFSKKEREVRGDK